MQATLPKLINNDQTEFIKAKFMGVNVGLIYSIISYTADKNMWGLILLLDFERALAIYWKNATTLELFR